MKTWPFFLWFLFLGLGITFLLLRMCQFAGRIFAGMGG